MNHDLVTFVKYHGLSACSKLPFIPKFQNEQMASYDKYETEQIGLWFTIEINQEEHVAFISTKALNERFEAEKKCISPLAAYKRHRKCIHSVAHRKVINGSTKQIILRVADFDLPA